jgi:8-oxo-dGTP diphosphatase
MPESGLLHPLVSADVAVFGVDQNVLQVLLVQRAQEPEIRRWALPGAVLKPDRDVDLEATARRALRDKISVELPHLEQVRVFSGQDRDPRGWSIGVLFYALLRRDQIHAVIRSKVDAVKWVDAAKPGHRLAFDHGVQLAKALQAVRDKVERHALPLHLLPEKFTLTELQRTCEAVLGRELDKSAFRRRLKSSEDLVEIHGEFVVGNQRPAQLYRAREGFVF